MGKRRISITETARSLRKKQTASEALLWSRLRNRQLGGYKFLRQYPVQFAYENGKRLFYVCDFYCAEKKLVIELDGAIHLEQVDYDTERDKILRDKGLITMRIANKALDNLPKVLDDILEKLESIAS